MAYALSDEMKIVDFEWTWRSLTTSTVGYSSNSWASCFQCSAHLTCLFHNSLIFSKCSYLLLLTCLPPPVFIFFSFSEHFRLIYHVALCLMHSFVFMIPQLLLLLSVEVMAVLFLALSLSFFRCQHDNS